MNYTVTEFRKNIRQILDAVDQGAEVVIERYNKRYTISPLAGLQVDPKYTLEQDSKGSPASITSTIARKVATKVNKRRSDLAAVGIKTTTATKIDGNKITTTITPDPKDVANFKAKTAPVVDQCPHGYAKGFCKKADCNRKYAK